MSHPRAGSVLVIMPEITTGDDRKVSHPTIELESKELNATVSSSPPSSAVSSLDNGDEFEYRHYLFTSTLSYIPRSKYKHHCDYPLLKDKGEYCYGKSISYEQKRRITNQEYFKNAKTVRARPEQVHAMQRCGPME